MKFSEVLAVHGIQTANTPCSVMKKSALEKAAAKDVAAVNRVLCCCRV